ncbi:hypothetical protein V494_08303 [Pseudogymnoascus sp. VKM F-4513 (FW-928)]|nr:hypothetical protein V494_08303 [Pseudogymnoascus sp. VKM F-4513 (FW-928)]
METVGISPQIFLATPPQANVPMKTYSEQPSAAAAAFHFSRHSGSSVVPETRKWQSSGPDSPAGGEPEEETEDYEARHGGSRGQPNAEHHDDGEHGGDDHGVEGAYLVCVEPGQPAAEDRPDVEDDEALVGEVLAEARVQGVAAYGAAGGAEAGGEAATDFEPVPDCGEGGGEDEGCGAAAEDAEDEHEMPVCSSNSTPPPPTQQASTTSRHAYQRSAPPPPQTQKQNTHTR